MIEHRLAAELTARQANHQLRRLSASSGVDFCSNDYLGLAKQTLQLAAGAAVESTAVESAALGSSGSRLVSGNDAVLEGVENHIADFHGFAHSLLFSSGYAANTGLLACLGKRGDLMLLDSLAHASLIDGARLSFAKRRHFAHQDLDDLAQQLADFKQAKTGQTKTGQAFVVVEAVYSMDGDTAALVELAALCKEMQAALIVDEAHSIGLLGAQGAGLIAELGLQQQVFAAIVTYGKAMGLHGAAVLGSKTLRDYLVNFCRPFIYSTAPSPHNVALLSRAYQQLRYADNARAKLSDNARYFADKVQSLPLKNAHWLPSDTPIQALILGDAARSKAVAQGLAAAGLAVKAIVSPTVAAGSERLRICLHSHNSHDEIDCLASALRQQVGVAA